LCDVKKAWEAGKKWPVLSVEKIVDEAVSIQEDWL